MAFRHCKICAVLVLFSTLLLSGCKDYRGLDELTIVTGIGIDLSEEDSELYTINFEIVDTNDVSEKDSVTTSLLESTGRSIAEAVSNAGQKLHNDMYFGNTEVVVVGEPLARTLELSAIVDPLLRDSNIRDNLTVLVSREKSAKDFMLATQGSARIIAFELNNAIGSFDRSSLNSTRALELDQVYSALSGNRDLPLPAVRLVGEEKSDIILDGLALFKNKKLIGFCEQTLVPYYVLATAPVQSGNLMLQGEAVDGAPSYVSFMDRQSRAKRSVSFDGEKFTLSVHVDIVVAAVEFSPSIQFHIDGDTTKKLGEYLETALSSELRAAILQIRDEFGADIFGFGTALHSRNPELWRVVSSDWEQWYRSAEIDVQCKVTINDTGLMKNY